MRFNGGFVVIAAVGLLSGVWAGEVGKSTPVGFTDDFATAKTEAAKANKKIVAVFSGSDWCYWCKELEKNYLSKPEFVNEAKKDFVLVFIDTPKDRAVLSEEASKNNAKLIERYGIRAFPTVKILGADGREIAESSPENGVTPKGYAEELRHAVKFGPLLERSVKPFQDEMDASLKDYQAAILTKRAELSKTKTGEELEKTAFEEMKKAGGICLAKLKTIKDKVEASKAPAEIGATWTKFVQRLDGMINGLEWSAQMSWDDVKKMREKIAKKQDGGVSSAENDAWLRDWSENVRTNKTLETCAGFRERKLRPFLLKEMDPEDKATSEELKILNAAIDVAWGEDGFKTFGKKKELVALLDRLAKKPFATMVKAFVEKKDARPAAVAWIESGKFADEDLRAVFWTLRNDMSVEDAEFSKQLERASVDPWIKATWRIGPARKAAWKSRGGGWAKDVSSEGWDGYRKSGDVCRASFGEAMKLKPYPEPVYCFMTLGPFENRVFEAATAALVDFPGLYRTYLWYNCFPRWCGSHAKMKAFAERCYATKRRDSMVPFFYAESLLRMLSDGAAKGGLEAYFRDHPDELDKIVEVTLPQINNRNATGPVRQCAGAYATLAYSLKGDWAKAGETFRSFGHGTFPGRIWDYIDNFSNWWMIWDGISGPNRKEFQAAHGLYAAGDCRGFLKKLEDLRKTCKLSAQERKYVNEMEVAARMKSTFLDGEPVVAAFPKDKMLWLTYGGAWRLNGEYAWFGGTTYNGGNSLSWDVPVPGEFRLECEIAPNDPAKDWTFVFYQMPDDSALAGSYRYPYLRMAFKSDSCKAAYGRWEDVKACEKGALGTFDYAGGTVKLEIVYRNGTASVFANGGKTPLIETDEHAQVLNATKSGRLRFNGTSVRLLSLKVRCP